MNRARLPARIAADLAAAQLRRDSLAFELTIAKHGAEPNWPELEVKLLDVEATIAELEAERAALAEVSAQSNPPASSPAPASPPDASPEYLDTRAAAALLGVTVKGLEGMRARGTGPKFTRIGNRIRYHRDDLRKG